MKRASITLIILLALVSWSSAQEKGITFEKNLNWQQVQAKAKAENKYIFIDCFATWCGPCKEMDKSTYPDEKVGAFFNEHFISVKMQMDSTKNDNDLVRAWYADARFFQKQYVVAYPSFLFFSPDGKIVDKWQGLQSPEGLINLGKEALDPDRQVDTLIERYHRRTLDHSLMPYLALKTSALGKLKLTDSIVGDYTDNYLFKLKPAELYTMDNLLFIQKFTKKPSEEGFAFFKNNEVKVDRVLGRYAAEKMQISVIVEGAVMPQINGKKLQENQWDLLKEKFERKYGHIGKIAVLQQRLLTDLMTGMDWKDFSKAYVLYFQNAGPLNIIDINNASYVVFLHSNDRKLLSFAITVMAPHKQEDANFMDTYANLLYKAGRTKEAMNSEKKAITLAPNDKEIQDSYAKMKKGERTWSTDK